jgi:hypothetical protein
MATSLRMKANLALAGALFLAVLGVALLVFPLKPSVKYTPGCMDNFCSGAILNSAPSGTGGGKSRLFPEPLQ